MKPPVCEVCDEKLDAEGGLLSFKMTEKDKEWHERSREEGFVGHPPEMAWFCRQHLVQAKELTHLSLSEALKEISVE